MRVNKLARGMLWGRLIASIETASKALGPASNHSGLLNPETGALVRDVQGRLADLEFLVWSEMEKERKKG